MPSPHEFLKTVPFDLYRLHLFHLVARHRSFTKAAEAAGLTQSAITRQIQTMETALGIDLLERTTRSVRVNPAGEFLLRESARLIGDVDSVLQQLREQFAEARKEVRVGVSRSVSLSHLPGFFHAQLRREPDVACRVASLASAEVFAGIEAHELDLGIVAAPARLPETLRVTHRFADAFTLIGPASAREEFSRLARTARARAAWLGRQNWILLSPASTTGARLHRWMQRQGWRVEPTMQLDGFDLVINLVALGLGVSFVPIRALALYRRKRNLHRLPLPVRFERELVVLVRRHRTVPPHVASFIDNVLF